MSVFTLDTRPDNPVTIQHVDDLCSSMGVTIRNEEKESYRTLLAVYHESMESLIALGGTFLSFVRLTNLFLTLRQIQNLP